MPLKYPLKAVNATSTAIRAAAGAANRFSSRRFHIWYPAKMINAPHMKRAAGRPASAAENAAVKMMELLQLKRLRIPLTVAQKANRAKYTINDS